MKGGSARLFSERDQRADGQDRGKAKKRAAVGPVGLGNHDPDNGQAQGQGVEARRCGRTDRGELGNYRKIPLTASSFREIFLLALKRSPRLDGGEINKGRVARFTPHRADTQIALNGETAAG